MSKFVYAIEGLDRLGKSTLIEGILQKQGFYQVIHFSKPRRLEAYEKSGDAQLFAYQAASFKNSMKLAQSGARLIFDRWHLGECVYAPLYRGYDGDYVFDIEERYSMNATDMVRLILLVEDFGTSNHFVTDGESIDDENRFKEQELFIQAFNQSMIQDKRIICVTDPETGNFRPAAEILEEALA